MKKSHEPSSQGLHQDQSQNQIHLFSPPVVVMPSQTETSNNKQVPPLTTEQRDWLKQNWGNEFKFLQAYGLSICKDEDRLEGREIMRAFIEADGQSG